jgi:hypothetical protein
MDLTIDFSVGGNAEPFQKKGWSAPEVAGTWSLGLESSIRLPDNFDEPHYLTLQVAGCVMPSQMSPQKLDVIFNNLPVASLEVGSPAKFDVILPPQVGETGSHEILFRHPDFRIPRDHGLPDDRELAINFRKIRLRPVSMVKKRETELRNRPQVMVIGQSHMAAVEHASIQRDDDDQSAFGFNFLSLTSYERWVWWEDGFQYESGLVSKIRNRIASLGCTTVISMLGGNAHFVYGALNHPRKFDFVIPSRPDLPPSLDAELVPYDMICDRARHDVESLLGIMGAACKSTGVKCFHVSAPPPVEDSDTLVKNLLLAANSELGRKMQSDLENFGAASAEFRLKVWLIYAMVTREVCKAWGIGYIDVPKAATDERGYFVPHLTSDSFHGIEAYGRMVLTEIEGRLGKAIS